MVEENPSSNDGGWVSTHFDLANKHVEEVNFERDEEKSAPFLLKAVEHSAFRRNGI